MINLLLKSIMGIAVLGLVLTLGGCGSSHQQSPISGLECANDIKVDLARGDTIKLIYDVDDFNKAQSLANAWCEGRNKYEKLSTETCKGCCVAVYRCYSE